jgi:enolase
VSRIVASDLAAIVDSRGQPTVEATIVLESGARGRVGAPSGASTGAHEVRAFPEGGATAAIRRFPRTVAPRLAKLDVADQAGIDAALHAADGTPDFSAIGGNTATAVSVAAAIARSVEMDVPLWRILARPGVERAQFPAIVGNCLNGGRHAIGGPDIQEFLAFAEAPRPEDSVRAAVLVHTLLGRELHRRFPTLALGRGDEGGWVAPVGNVEALELLAAACATARDELKTEVHPGLDLAASEFYRDGKYRYQDRALDAEDQVAFVAKLVDDHGLRYVEDPLDEEAFDGFAAVTRAIGDRAVVVGDDLYCTRVPRLERGIALGSSNSALIKVNQAGTLSDTFAAVDLARSHGLSTVTSHRSGDLPEGWLAHLAVGTAARGLKCGVLGGERVAKLNELLRLGRATG